MPSTIGTSTSITATSVPCQRKGFYATGRHWEFYCSASTIYFTSSPDGVNWDTPTNTLEYLDANSGLLLSVRFDGTYVHLAWIYVNEVRYKRGTPKSDGTITWSPDTPQLVVGRYFRDEFDYDSSLIYLYKAVISGNIWQIRRAGGYVADYTTEVNIGSYGAGYKFVFNPYSTVTTPFGTTLPTTIQNRGWEYYVAAASKLTCFGGRIQAIILVRNPDAIVHAGNLYVRLWVSDNSDMSGAVALTSWAYTAVSFNGTAGQTISVTVNCDTALTVGDAYAFKDKYFYIELLWDVTTPATNARVQVEANLYSCLQPPQIIPYHVMAVGYGGAVITVDSNGYPWIGFACHNGLYVLPYTAQGNATNGTWNWRTASIRRLHVTHSIRWCCCPIALTNGKMLIIYTCVGTDFYSQYWNGSVWGSEVTTGADIIVSNYFSVIRHDDTVEMVYLETTSYDVEHIRWTADSWSSVATVQAASTSTSAPVLTINPDTDEMWCFWAGSPSANHVYYKKYSDVAWDASPTDWLDETADSLTANDRVTCFAQVYSNLIGLEYMTKPITSSPYNVRYAFLSLLVARMVGEGLTFVVG